MGYEEKMQDRSRPFAALLHSSFQPTPLFTRSLGSDRFPQQSLCRFVGPRRTWIGLHEIAKVSVKDNKRAIIEACFSICLLGHWQKMGALWAPTLGKYIWVGVHAIGVTVLPLELPKRQARMEWESWGNGLPYPAFALSCFFLLWQRACLLITVQNITMFSLVLIHTRSAVMDTCPQKTLLVLARTQDVF